MHSDLHELKRDIRLAVNKVKNIVEFPENLKAYLKERREAIEAVSESDLEKLIEGGIQKYYEKKMKARFDAYEHIAQVAQTKDKRDLFSYVRNFLINEKLTKPVEPQPNANEAMNMLLIFPKNDRDSFLLSPQREVEFDKHLKYENLGRQEQRVEDRAKMYKDRYGDYLQEFEPQVNSYYERLLSAAEGNQSL